MTEAEKKDADQIRSSDPIQAPQRIGTLAFVGDAVYELYVRQTVAMQRPAKASELHGAAIRYVRAEAQAFAVRLLLQGFLTEEERIFVKRARNHKTPNRSRSAGLLEYRYATAFEALIGRLWLTEEKSRAQEIMRETLRLLDEKGINCT